MRKNGLSPAVQDMTAEELEEMMKQAGQSQSGEGKELQVSMEAKEGGAPGGDEQQCVFPSCTSLSFRVTFA